MSGYAGEPTGRAPFKEIEASREDYKDMPWSVSKTPKPEWKVGSGANSNDWKKYKTKELDVTKMESRDTYKLLIAGVVPRPIGFVSTTAPDGTTNLAPFSYTNLANHDPPVISVGINMKDPKNPKDSLKNILDTKEFVVNIISEWFIEAANYTSIDAPAEISEWDLTGLTQVPSSTVKPARVAESAFVAECQLLHHYIMHSDKTGHPTGAIVLGKITRLQVREDILDGQGSIDPDKLKPISRLGGITYGRTTHGFELPRPVFAKVKPELEEAGLIKKDGAPASSL